jgi:hypothetical protein
VALQGDRLVVGAPYDSSTASQGGVAYVFDRTGDAWAAPTKLTPSSPHANAMFGFGVAVDANTIVIGADDRSGLPMSASGGAGSAYAYVLRDGMWSEQQVLRQQNPEDGAVFGWRVAIQGDTVAVGAPRADWVTERGHGEVYLFERVNEQWTASQILSATTPRNSDYFGNTLALTHSTLLVGVPGDSSGARGFDGDSSRNDAAYSGALYMFERDVDHWTQSAYIKASNTAANARFSDGVVTDGEMIVVGAGSESSSSMGISTKAGSGQGAESSGAVYVLR